MKKMVEIISEYPLFQGLTPEHLAFIAGCVKNVVFNEGQTIARAGDPANEFYLIREGRVSLAIDRPPQKPFLFQTLGAHDILGISWLIPPYRWITSAQAVHTTRALALDGPCVRKKCEEDPALGYALMKQLTQVLVKREESVILHLLDVYGNPQKN